MMNDTEPRYRDSFETAKDSLQLQQSQKLEAIGQLAGSVAHDFNNLLTAILGYTDLSLRRTDIDDRIRHNLEETRKAAERATALNRQLLALMGTVFKIYLAGVDCVDDRPQVNADERRSEKKI